MLVLSRFLATQPVHLTGRVVAAVLALGVLGTGQAYVWNTNVVTGSGAVKASTVTYLTPLPGGAMRDGPGGPLSVREVARDR